MWKDFIWYLQGSPVWTNDKEEEACLQGKGHSEGLYN